MYPSFRPARPQSAGENNQAKQPISLSNNNADDATSSKSPILFDSKKLWPTFSIISSLSQDKMLEKHHRHCGLGKKETDDANGPCYSNHNVFNSDDFGCDAIVDNDWLVVSGINPDFKEEYILQQATPADERAPPKQDLLYQAALAAAAQKAAAAGKFDRNTSPKLLAKLTTDSSESLQTSNINDTLMNTIPILTTLTSTTMPLPKQMLAPSPAIQKDSIFKSLGYYT
ncbi:hypothetical protein V8F06_014672 [Rhypophila decipiens]